KVYLTVTGDGAVVVVDRAKAVPFATGLGEPRGLAAYQQWLFVADKQQVWRIDRKGKAQIFAAAAAFPSPPRSLHDLTPDPEGGTLYVSDAGDSQGKGGAVYRISPAGKVAVVTDAGKWPGLHTPSALLLDGASHLLVADAGSGELHRINLAGGSTEKLADGLQIGRASCRERV